MANTMLRCVSCGKTTTDGKRYACDKCQGVLDVVYDNVPPSDGPLSQTFCNMPISREEGNGIGLTPTPLLRAERLGQELGMKGLCFKCEFANLSGSFKDRPVAIAVAMAKKLGYKQVVTASSGNAAAATAACAARHGLGCIVIVPASTPDEKVKQTMFYGAKVFKVPGPYSNSYQVAKELAEQYGVYNVTTTFLNPYALEGDKLVGYELYETLGAMPQWVYVPVGAGPLLVGIYKGLNEYAAVLQRPSGTKMVAVQAQGNAPIAAAFAQGSDQVLANEHPNTIAGGIADGLVGYERDGEYTLRVCRESQGAVRSVDDDDIRSAQKQLAQLEGIFVEPSAAAAVAGVIKDRKAGLIKDDDLVVAVLTGHGLKDMKSVTIHAQAKTIQKTSDVADELH